MHAQSPAKAISALIAEGIRLLADTKRDAPKLIGADRGGLEARRFDLSQREIRWPPLKKIR